MISPDLSPQQLQKSSAILTAARGHFALHGFEATKLSEVAKDAGVAVGTIYLRYTSKAELLSGVLGEVERSFCEAMDTQEIWASPFPERFQLIVSAVLDTAGAQPDLAALMRLSSFAPAPDAESKRVMLTKIEEHIQDGIARKELRADVQTQLAAAMAHGMVEGAMRELMHNPARDPSDTVAHIAEAYRSWLTRA